MAKKKSTKKTPKIKAKPEVPAKTYATIEQAAAHCKVVPSTFRNYILKYPDLPIHAKSSTGGGYQIDLEALDKWREEHGLLNWVQRDLYGEGKKPKMATKDRKAEIQTEILQIELDKMKGLLVPRDEVVKAIATKFAQLAKRLDLFPAYLGRKVGLTPEAVEVTRKFHDELRIALGQDNELFFEAIELQKAKPDEHLL